jgi:hypothetical protein
MNDVSVGMRSKIFEAEALMKAMPEAIIKNNNVLKPGTIELQVKHHFSKRS